MSKETLSNRKSHWIATYISQQRRHKGQHLHENGPKITTEYHLTPVRTDTATGWATKCWEYVEFQDLPCCWGIQTDTATIGDNMKTPQNPKPRATTPSSHPKYDLECWVRLQCWGVIQRMFPTAEHGRAQCSVTGAAVSGRSYCVPRPLPVRGLKTRGSHWQWGVDQEPLWYREDRSRAETVLWTPGWRR